jgi:hypothetical protein
MKPRVVLAGVLVAAAAVVAILILKPGTDLESPRVPDAPSSQPVVSDFVAVEAPTSAPLARRAVDPTTNVFVPKLARESRPIDARDLDDARLVARVARLYDGRATDLVWAELGDMPTLRGIVETWGPKIGEARQAVAMAKATVHAARYDAGLCQEYPKAEHRTADLQRPQHPLQVVAVGEHRYPDGREVYRVSRFEPGDDPGIDAAMAKLLQVRAELMAELERIRGGR